MSPKSVESGWTYKSMHNWHCLCENGIYVVRLWPLDWYHKFYHPVYIQTKKKCLVSLPVLIELRETIIVYIRYALCMQEDECSILTILYCWYFSASDDLVTFGQYGIKESTKNGLVKCFFFFWLRFGRVKVSPFSSNGRCPIQTNQITILRIEFILSFRRMHAHSLL